MSVNSTTYKKILSKGKEENLPTIEDGKLRFTTDTGRLFLDNNNTRIEFSDFVKDKTKAQILELENPLPKFYLATDTHELYFYNGVWQTINSSTVSYAANAGTSVVSNDSINNISRNGLVFTATRKDGSTFTFAQQDTNTTYENATTESAGLLPILDGSTSKYLRSDGVWDIPSNNLSGSEEPTTDIGRDGSVYYRIDDGEIKDIYYKINNDWLKYNPTQPTPPTPPSEELLYSWDFRESMIDSVNGLENVPGAGIQTYDYIPELVNRDNEKGLTIYDCWGNDGPMAQIPVDLRNAGYKIEIEFGEFELNYSDYMQSLIGSYSDPDQHQEGEYDQLQVGILYYNGVEIHCYPSAAGYIEDGSQLIDTSDNTYFANSKVTIKTVAPQTQPETYIIDPADYSAENAEIYYSAMYTYNVLWEIYKDDVLVGTTPQVYTGRYLSRVAGVPTPEEAKFTTMGYFTDEPEGYFKNIKFCIPINCDSALEIKTLKIWKINE